MKILNKKSLWVVIFMVAGAVAGPKPAFSGPQPIPPKDFQVENFPDQVILLDFWASWCKPCEKSMLWLAHLQTEFGSKGLQVVAVNLDRDWQDAEKMASSLPPKVVLVHDPKGILAAERNLQGMPSTYLYDRQGRLAVVHVGFLPGETAEKEAEILALLDGVAGDFDQAALGDDIAGVQPWQRDLLAAPGMAIDPDPIETSLNEHTYFSKEATSGGLGSAGGGCGCN